MRRETGLMFRSCRRGRRHLKVASLAKKRCDHVSLSACPVGIRLAAPKFAAICSNRYFLTFLV